MNNAEIRDFAISLLEKLDMNQVDGIQIQEDSYRDGEPYLEITVDYHLKGGEE